MAPEMQVSPGLSGVSLIKIPVTDPAASLNWYETVFGASRISQLDHVAADGSIYAYMLSVPGLPCPVQLRLAPKTAHNISGFDPIGFVVKTRSDLESWEAFLVTKGIANSSVLRGLVGWFLVVRDPDGLSIRLFSDEHHELDPVNAVVDGPWLTYPAES